MKKGKWKKPFNAFVSVGLMANLLVPAIPMSASAAANNASELIISEYIEGSSSNKAIELYNGTSAEVDLSEYIVELYSNGSTTVSNSLALNGKLAPGDTYVLYHGNANDPIKAKGDHLNSSVINFNGNDPIVLKRGTTVVDSIGQVGSVENWGADVTLVRNSNISTGDTTIDDPFDPSIEWKALPKDDTSNLGTHEMDETTAPVENKVESVTVSVPSSSVEAGTSIKLSTKTEGASIYYTTDGSDPSTDSTLYEAPIVIEEDVTIKAIAVADGLENSNIASYTYTILENRAISEVREQELGAEVITTGVVTAKLKNTIQIQDETAAIAIRPTSLNVQLGDQITIKGTLGEYNKLLQINSATLVGEASHVGVPATEELTGAELNEENESKLAVVKNVTIEDVQQGSGWANYTVTDGNASFIVRDENGILNLSVGKTYDSISGIVQQFNEDFQIIPRGIVDVLEDASVVQAVLATPGEGLVAAGTTVTLSTPTDGAEIYYTTNGQDPVQNGSLYTGPVTIDQDMTIKVYAKKDGLNPSEVKEFTYEVFDAEEGMKIHHLQGESHYSPLDGTFVNNIKGVVTYRYELNGGNYLHIQTPDDEVDDNPNTSEALVIYTGNREASVEIGDLVSVTGTVDEYHIDGYSDKGETDLPITQINARDDRGGKIVVVESDVTLPAPIVISDNLPTEVIDNDSFAEFDPEEDAIDFWESLEGMRVQVGNSKAVAPQEHGDLIVVLEETETETIMGGIRYKDDDKNAERIQFKLHPNGDARDFKVATGDKFEGPVTGVVNYGYQNYKIYAELADLQAAFEEGTAQPETTTIVKDEDKLTIASYNLENFSNNPASDETPNSKAEKLARALANDMDSPDIIGVTEVQDNNGQDAGDSDASQSYERLINAIVEKGGPRYSYVNINPVNNADGGAPNANIRVGFLYNPERVSLTDGAVSGTATEAVDYADGKLTLNPGRIDPQNDAFANSRKPLAAQFEFNGESVVVVANHFNSKSGDTALFGSTQPPVLGSEAQRIEIAKIVNGFVKDVLADKPDENVVILGDLNDYEFSKPLQVLKGAELTNMIDQVEESDRYTYLYQGNSQVLDHILVSNNLAQSTEVDILHINADFTDMHGRASDHDPVMVQIDLKKGQDENPDEEPVQVDKTYNLSNYKTDKLTIKTPKVELNVGELVTITEGIFLTGEYAELTGAGLEKLNVTIKPDKPGAIVDFKDSHVQKVIVDGQNVKEIRGATNVRSIVYKNGASADSVTIKNPPHGTLAFEHLDYLANDIGPRIAGTEKERLAEQYIKSQFQELGLETAIQEFSYTRRGATYNSSNIVAYKPGESSKQIIVGAHYDSVSAGRGVDDNASGVGVMLEAAEALKNIETPYSIVFIAFGAEEVGLQGSNYYANNMTEEQIANTVGMINLDSLAVGDHMYVYGSAGEDGFIRELALKIAQEKKLNVGTNPGVNPAHPAGTTGDWSDHAPFKAKGIPYGYLEATNWEIGDQDGYTQTVKHGGVWHTDNDTLEFINEEFPGRVEEHLYTFSVLLTEVLKGLNSSNTTR